MTVRFGWAQLPGAPPKPDAGGGSPTPHLQTFLTSRGVSVSDLLAGLVAAVGSEPALAVVGGSGLQGFANANSDVDVYLVSRDGPGEAAPPQPSSVTVGGVVLDFVRSDNVTLDACVTAVVAPDTSTLSGWRQAHEALGLLSRFGTGLAVAGTVRWLHWQQHILPSLLPAHQERWWMSEAVRHAALAQATDRADRFVATQHTADARLAAMEVEAVRQGHWYFNRKWLPLKLADVQPLRATLLASTDVHGGGADRVLRSIDRLIQGWLSSAHLRLTPPGDPEGVARPVEPAVLASPSITAALLDGTAWLSVDDEDELAVASTPRTGDHRRLAALADDVAAVDDLHALHDRVADIEGALVSGQPAVAALGMREVALLHGPYPSPLASRPRRPELAGRCLDGLRLARAMIDATPSDVDALIDRLGTFAAGAVA